MAFYLRGVKVPHFKHTHGMLPEKMTSVKKVTIPTVMHIGAPAKPVVKKGDEVKVGTLIAKQEGFVSSPIYSSVSGKVSAIEDMVLSNGKTAPAIVIESDGEMSLDENIKVPSITSKEDLIEAIKQSGIVGLGGAGFPTFVKFATDKKIEVLLINGAECEPYITSDSVTMTERADDIFYALNFLINYFGIEKVIFGIEKNKPEAIKKITEMSSDKENISVKVLPSYYPQGAEKVLIYHTTGKVTPMGKLPIDVGAVVCNSSTVAEIGKYLKTGIPLVDRCVTVDGNAVTAPKNVIAPIGTPVSDLLEFCGGAKAELQKVLYGGPMMGISVPDTNAPVIKNTNAVLFFDENGAREPKPTNCIKCGACAHHCPLGIDPTKIAKALKEDDSDALIKAGTELCMLCGCCSFVCPAKRPIVQNNKLAKSVVAEAKAKREEK